MPYGKRRDQLEMEEGLVIWRRQTIHCRAGKELFEFQILLTKRISKQHQNLPSTGLLCLKSLGNGAFHHNAR